MSNPGYAARLRQELAARALAWAEKGSVPYEQSVGAGSSVLFFAADEGHGNFHPASYRAILRRPEWRRRLQKTHTTAHKILVSHDRERSELDCCSSSDALLMNIFCHPSVSSRRSAVRSSLSLASDAEFVFGHRPRVPMLRGRIDCTEVDLWIGNVFLEAKLTEADFQCAPWPLAERYVDFASIFDPALLPRSGERVDSYQLVRGILAAFAQEDGRYCLICDERRPDLIERWAQLLAAMRRHDQRWRCVLVTWQELARSLPKTLQNWLGQKYGIA